MGGCCAKEKRKPPGGRSKWGEALVKPKKLNPIKSKRLGRRKRRPRQDGVDDSTSSVLTQDSTATAAPPTLPLRFPDKAKKRSPKGTLSLAAPTPLFDFAAFQPLTAKTQPSAPPPPPDPPSPKAPAEDTSGGLSLVHSAGVLPTFDAPSVSFKPPSSVYQSLNQDDAATARSHKEPSLRLPPKPSKPSKAKDGKKEKSGSESNSPPLPKKTAEPKKPAKAKPAATASKERLSSAAATASKAGPGSATGAKASREAPTAPPSATHSSSRSSDTESLPAPAPDKAKPKPHKDKPRPSNRSETEE